MLTLALLVLEMSYMVAQQDAPRLMTVEEWRELERASHDAKHEYIDGQVYALAGGSRAHARIASNTLRAVEDALAAAHRPCNVSNSAGAARRSPRRYTYPDETVTCDDRDQATTATRRRPRPGDDRRDRTRSAPRGHRSAIGLDRGVRPGREVRLLPRLPDGPGIRLDRHHVSGRRSVPAHGTGLDDIPGVRVG